MPLRLRLEFPQVVKVTYLVACEGCSGARMAGPGDDGQGWGKGESLSLFVRSLGEMR
jgi:hypothetical protein